MGQHPLGETPEVVARKTRTSCDYFLLVDPAKQLTKANERRPEEQTGKQINQIERKPYALIIY